MNGKKVIVRLATILVLVIPLAMIIGIVKGDESISYGDLVVAGGVAWGVSQLFMSFLGDRLEPR